MMSMVALALALVLQAEAPCPATPATPPAIFGGWSMRTPLKAGTSSEDAPKIETGNGFDATLGQTLNFELKPEKASDAGTYGGTIEIQIDRSGVLAIGLGADAWLDLVQGGAALKPDSFGHGPRCTGIVKQVRYAVGQGQYILQVSNAKSANLSVVIGEE